MKFAAPALSAAILAQFMPSLAVAERDFAVLEEVIVTATRRAESLQEVPMSISAFDSDFLQKSGVTELADLEQYTPNLKIVPSTDANATSFRIRGIGSTGSNSGIDPSVGMFIDGIYQGRTGMSVGDLVDVERVEILRGPQGTLYGKNTAAGAISVITKLPNDQRDYLAELRYDSNELLSLRGMVNIPLGDSGHAMRVSGFVADGDHLYTNTYTGNGLNDTQRYGGRARLLLDLEGSRGGANLGQFVFSLDYTRDDADCCAIATLDYDGLSPLNSPATASASAALQAQLGQNALGQDILRYFDFASEDGAPPVPDAFDDNYWLNFEPSSKVDSGGIGLEWNREIGGGNTLTFINAWRFYDFEGAFDGDFTAYEAATANQEVDLDQYSSELRLTSPGDQTIDYLGGLYFYHSEFDSVGSFGQLEDLVHKVILFGDVTLGTFLPQGSVNTDTNTYTTTSYAAFGQLIWNISDTLSATLGLRYTYEKKEREGSQITVPTFAFDAPPIAGPDIFYDDQRSDTDLSPSLNLRYFINPEIMTYASVSRGFKSGGYDQRRQALGLTGEFDEEIATNYEIGWKTTWADRRAQFNGTLFYVDYEDFQSQSWDGATIRVVNAGDMESYGAELELIVLPTANITAGAAIGYNKAEYSSFDNGQCTIEQTFFHFYVTEGAQTGAPGTSSVCTQDLKGKPLDNAPEWTVSSFLQYDWGIGDSLLAGARLEHNFTDGYFLDQDLDPRLENDPVNLVNVRFTLANTSKTWELALWGQNVLDEDYLVWGLDTPTIGGYSGVVAPGEVFGLTFRLFD